MHLRPVLLILVYFGLAGKCQHQFSAKIIGGDTVPKDQPLFQVSVKDRSFNQKCIGTIIRPKYVITTARCIVAKVPNHLQVFVGSVYLNQFGYIFPPVQLMTHPYFDNDTLRDNLGLIKTGDSMLTAPGTRQLPLPVDYTYPGAVCALYGWGGEGVDSSSLSARLRRLNTTVTSLADCQSVWSDEMVTIDNVCTGEHLEFGACSGDEGAPIVRNDALVGVLSFGGRCFGDLPEVYVNIINYVVWINAVATD